MDPRSRPLIAIDGELCTDGKSELRLRQSYARAVWKAGGMPVALPPLPGSEFAAAVLEFADGVLFSGGDDFNTEALGAGPVHPAAKPVPAEKQAFDVDLARTLLDANLPVLGICYGMQLLALATGGTLHQHLPENLPGAREHRGGTLHPVTALPGSKLATAVGVDPFMVVSRHHQAVAALSADAERDGWVVSARDDQGLIEGIERSTPDSFVVGVQWHPELHDEGGDREHNEALFHAFVAAARERRTHLLGSR
ncbi:MAG TPA: gamma-glutamyl-gamma-aminobutyrate hydrolase family protein [Planctomycetes bacterium]|nr:gamma-glutamyl-gamma-aminobutyrate hydrolase family protein [Planctomycetota bacterium]